MLTYNHTNRYNDIISFVQSGDWTIRMIGGDYFRYGWKTDEQIKNKEYTMADPSGGPYIASGLDMGRFMKEWKGMIVKHITPDTNGENVLHLFQGRMMKGVTNGEEELRWYKAGDSSGDYETYNDMEQFLVAQNGNQ